MTSPESHKSYRPLTVLTFRWNRQLHDMDPLGFHAVNVLLHGLVSILFLLLLRRVGVPQMISLAAVLLFATHPIHTEAVSDEISWLLRYEDLPHGIFVVAKQNCTRVCVCACGF